MKKIKKTQFGIGISDFRPVGSRDPEEESYEAC